MNTDISIYFAFSTGIILLIAAIYKMIIDRSNYRWYFVPLIISLIIIGYGIKRVYL